MIKTSGLRKKKAGIGAKSHGAGPGSQLLTQLRQEDGKCEASLGCVEGLDSDTGPPRVIQQFNGLVYIGPQCLVQGGDKNLQWAIHTDTAPRPPPVSNV